jgi:hypothetical protein
MPVYVDILIVIFICVSDRTIPAGFKGHLLIFRNYH